MSLEAVFGLMFAPNPVKGKRIVAARTSLPANSYPSTTAEDVDGFLLPMLGARNLLDYGCGKGRDVRFYRSSYFRRNRDEVACYDPPFTEDAMPEGPFDVITSVSVLNVIPEEKERVRALKRMVSASHRNTVFVVDVRDKAGIAMERKIEPEARPYLDGWVFPIDWGGREVVFQRGFSPRELDGLASQAGLVPFPLEMDASDGGFSAAFVRRDYRGWPAQPFLQQRHGKSNDCLLYALANAVRWYGLPSPAPGTRDWKKLVKLGRGEDGPLLGLSTVARTMGLSVEKFGAKKRAVAGKENREFSWEIPWPKQPVIVSITPPGESLHAALWVGENARTFVAHRKRGKSLSISREKGPFVCLVNAEFDKGPVRRWFSPEDRPSLSRSASTRTAWIVSRL